MTAPVQMCTVNDLTGGPECLRMARWCWTPEDDDHPVFLCNHHAEPLIGEPELRAAS